jgi:Ca2+-binding RTX toxin-like protein
MGGYSDLTATGNSLDNIISGNGYYDTLDGGAGADTMYGWGSDTYIVDNIGDVVIDEDGSIPRLPTSMSQIVSQEGSANVMEVGVGNEDKILSSVSYTLPNGVDVLTLTGKSAINGTGNEYSNYLTGNGGVNILTGGNGWDTLDGGAGADTLIGGFGDDTYITDNAGDVIIENADEGIDTVQSSVTYTISPNVENIILTGASRISGTGNELNNQLTGNGTVNTLTGNAGNDTLDGGLGKDSLVGGAENDTYLFRVGSGQDAVDNYDTSSGRVDTIRFMDVTSYGLRGVTQSGNDLVLEYGSTDKVTIKNFYSGSAYQVDQFTFSDNVTLSTAELLAAYGSVGSLAATKAIFTQEQTTVNSTFLNSSIHEMGYNGYIGSDLANVVRSMSNDMFSSANDGFKRMNDGTERLEVFDGHYVTRQDIENIVNTMSAINNNAGMDVMQKYNAMMQDQTYISTLAQTWKQV